MSNAVAFTVIGISSLSFIASAATLGLTIFGAKKVEKEVEDLRTKVNTQMGKIKKALKALASLDLEF